MNTPENKTHNPAPSAPNNRGRFSRGPGNNGGRKFGGSRPPRQESDTDSKVLNIARVTRVTGGGKRFSFRTTIVVGNGKGSVGVGVAQGVDVAQSMQKATHDAKKHMVHFEVKDGTIAHELQSKYKSAKVVLKPAAKGRGVKAGGPVRVVARLAGIENLTAKLLSRSTNKINIARATIQALASLRKSK